MQQFFVALEAGAIKEGGHKVFVAGLPLQNTPSEEEIKSIMSRFGDVSCVELKYDAQGAFRGFCYVNYDTLEAARECVLNHQKFEIGGNIIDCKPAASKEEMNRDKALDGKGKGNKGKDMGKFGKMMEMFGFGGMGGCGGGGKGKGPRQEATSPVLRLRGMPFEQNTSDDLWRFFQGFEVITVLPKAGTDSTGKPKGEAFVELVSLYEATRALNQLQGAMLGPRYIEIFPSSPLDLAVAMEEKQQNPALADQPTTRSPCSW